MSIRRFMIDSNSMLDGHATLGGDLFNHIVRVLRMEPGAPLILVDEKGFEHRGVIEQVHRERVIVRVNSSLAATDSSDDTPRLTICQALPKGEKTELILQKGTELGVHDFLLFGGRRSVPRIREEQQAGKLQRWNRVTAEAARQCGRRSIPGVCWFPGAAEAVSCSTHDLRLLLWEEEQARNLKSALTDVPCPASAIVAIGPEGGFDPGEVRCFIDHGFLPITLGERILRAETATLAITSILQYIWEKI
ncbi:MAG: 16S rRNA (uracil(1498)-N(3))-methyltransferase [Desulfuromonadales bacterium]|nr:16S rRNA (uracil(1498)-N(3))-methyltransferase [Desulfuromonadales bacterium]